MCRLNHIPAPCLITARHSLAYFHNYPDDELKYTKVESWEEKSQKGSTCSYDEGLYIKRISVEARPCPITVVTDIKQPVHQNYPSELAQFEYSGAFMGLNGKKASTAQWPKTHSAEQSKSFWSNYNYTLIVIAHVQYAPLLSMIHRNVQSWTSEKRLTFNMPPRSCAIITCEWNISALSTLKTIISTCLIHMLWTKAVSGY